MKILALFLMMKMVILMMVHVQDDPIASFLPVKALCRVNERLK